MRCMSMVVVLVMSIGVSAATADAPPRHRGWYGVYGYDSALVIYDLNSDANARRYVAQSERLLGQQIAAQQMAALQGGIRNTIEASGQQRMQNILGQQQADHDWWLQTQQQQIAQRQAQAAQLALMKAAAEVNPPAAALELIRWPPALRNSRFAEQRATIEAPYRRGSNVPSAPLARDYRDMVDAVAQMRTILKGMADDVSPRDYRDATAFLDQLAAEARSHVDRTPAKPW
jgi:hypothetical protein